MPRLPFPPAGAFARFSEYKHTTPKPDIPDIPDARPSFLCAPRRRAGKKQPSALRRPTSRRTIQKPLFPPWRVLRQRPFRTCTRAPPPAHTAFFFRPAPAAPFSPRFACPPGRTDFRGAARPAQKPGTRRTAQTQKAPAFRFKPPAPAVRFKKPLFPPRRAHSVNALFTPVPMCSPQPGVHHLFLSLCPGKPCSHFASHARPASPHRGTYPPGRRRRPAPRGNPRPPRSPNAKSPRLPFQATRRSVQKPLFPPRRAHSVNALFTPVPMCSPQPGARHLFLSLCPGSPILTSLCMPARPALARVPTRPAAPASKAPPEPRTPVLRFCLRPAQPALCPATCTQKPRLFSRGPVCAAKGRSLFYTPVLGFCLRPASPAGAGAVPSPGCAAPHTVHLPFL